MSGGKNNTFVKSLVTGATGGLSDLVSGYGAITDLKNSVTGANKKAVGTPLDSAMAGEVKHTFDTTLQDALNNQDVDDTTKLEIQQMVNADKQAYDAGKKYLGADALTKRIKATVKLAESGKGIYGIRMKNQQERSILADMPGRGQTVMGGGR